MVYPDVKNPDNCHFFQHHRIVFQKPKSRYASFAHGAANSTQENWKKILFNFFIFKNQHVSKFKIIGTPFAFSETLCLMN